MTVLALLRVGSFVSVGGASGRASVAALAAGADITQSHDLVTHLATAPPSV